MAETFGVVAGALSVAALFTTCVTCFEYVQLGRSFGQDYERCRLKVDIAHLRLSRWGEAVDIYTDPRFATASPDDPHTRTVKKALDMIDRLFQSLKETSERYEQKAKPIDLAVGKDEDDMRPIAQRLHNRFAQVTRHRQKKTSFSKKAAWALYEGQQFDRLLGQITGLIGELEIVWPVKEAAGKLVQLEIEGVDDEQALRAIQAEAAGIDNILTNAARHKANGIAVQNLAGDISQQDTAFVRVGNEYTEKYTNLFTTITDQTINKAGKIDARGDSRTHIGNSYGGRSIFG